MVICCGETEVNRRTGLVSHQGFQGYLEFYPRPSFLRAQYKRAIEYETRRSRARSSERDYFEPKLKEFDGTSRMDGWVGYDRTAIRIRNECGREQPERSRWSRESHGRAPSDPLSAV